MKKIEMMWDNRIVARIEEGKFIPLVTYAQPNLAPNLKAMYDSCFYRSPAKSFEEQWEKASKHEYFCSLNPYVRLIAIDDELHEDNTIDIQFLKKFVNKGNELKLFDLLEKIDGNLNCEIIEKGNIIYSGRVGDAAAAIPAGKVVLDVPVEITEDGAWRITVEDVSE